MLVYDSKTFEFQKGDRVTFLPGNSLHAQGHRAGTVTAVGRRLVHVKSDQTSETFHVAPRLIADEVT